MLKPFLDENFPKSRRNRSPKWQFWGRSVLILNYGFMNQKGILARNSVFLRILHQNPGYGRSDLENHPPPPKEEKEK